MLQSTCARMRSPILISAAFVAFIYVAFATAREHADAQSPPVPVDTRACPTYGTVAEARADPLEGPEAEDDYTEPTEPEPAAAAANQNLNPTVRAPNTAEGALAAVDSQTESVHLGLIRWCVVEPDPPNPNRIYKRDPDGTLDAFTPGTRWRPIRTAFRNVQQ